MKEEEEKIIVEEVNTSDREIPVEIIFSDEL